MELGGFRCETGFLFGTSKKHGTVRTQMKNWEKPDGGSGTIIGTFKVLGTERTQMEN